MKLGIDLDGVCADFTNGAVEALHREFRITVPLIEGDVPTWDYIEEQVGPERWSWIWRKAVPQGLFGSLNVMPGAREAISRLSEHDVFFLTNRPRNARRDTYRWVLESFHIQPAGIITFKTGESKGVLPCDFYIDDKPENCELIARDQPDARVILHNRLYNRGYGWPGVRVDNLIEFADIVLNPNRKDKDDDIPL